MTRHRGRVSLLTKVVCPLILGFYFLLLRKGEYLGYPNEAAPDSLFPLRDLTLWVGTRAPLITCNVRWLTFMLPPLPPSLSRARRMVFAMKPLANSVTPLCPVLCLVTCVVALRQF